ncbi:MAG: hypothetical protein IKO93_07355, partial [Lentisphaeria bacterium]|nr:hypothetical protein [Lentisphaeria bacterium]
MAKCNRIFRVPFTSLIAVSLFRHSRLSYLSYWSYSSYRARCTDPSHNLLSSTAALPNSVFRKDRAV